MAKPRVLIASQPAAWRGLRGMLEEVMDLVPVHSIDRGLETLDGRAGGFAMGVSTVAFDESRMVDFLLAVKSRPPVSAVPFVCCRLLPTVLPGESLVRLAEVCRLAGAA